MTLTVSERKFSLDELDRGDGIGMRLPRSTAKKLIKNGVLASIVIGGRRYVSESQLQDFFRRCEVAPKSEIRRK